MRERMIRHSISSYIDVFWCSISPTYVAESTLAWYTLLRLMYLGERSIVLIAALVYTGYFRYTMTNPLLARVFSDSFSTCRQSAASAALIVSVKIELIS